MADRTRVPIHINPLCQNRFWVLGKIWHFENIFLLFGFALYHPHASVSPGAWQKWGHETHLMVYNKWGRRGSVALKEQNKFLGGTNLSSCFWTFALTEHLYLGTHLEIELLEIIGRYCRYQLWARRWHLVISDWWWRTFSPQSTHFDHFITCRSPESMD